MQLAVVSYVAIVMATSFVSHVKRMIKSIASSDISFCEVLHEHASTEFLYMIAICAGKQSPKSQLDALVPLTILIQYLNSLY